MHEPPVQALARIMKCGVDMIPKNIVVPTDFSACAAHAVDYACALAAKLGATVHLVNALGATPSEVKLALSDAMLDNLIRAQEEGLAKVAAAHRALVTFGAPFIKPGDPRDAILEVARAVDADLIVMGTHGRRGLSRLVMGSVAEDIVRNAPCPVLTVRSKGSGEPV